MIFIVFFIYILATSPRKWKCPICKKASWALEIDQYMLKILREVNQLNDDTIMEVTFDKTGKYQIVKEDEGDDYSDTPF